MPVQFTDTDFLKKARERFKLANEADSDQAQREQDDIRFEAGDQWPADIKLARQGQQPTNGMPSVPARPTLVINKVKEPVRQILNSERASDIGIELVPADDFGDLGILPDDTEVQLREGLVRRIQRDSQAADARTWAFKRAVIAGRGYYLVLPRYLPGKTIDQEICIERIYNQESVKGDPSRTQPDGSDAAYWFWGTWMLSDRFKAEFPKAADGKSNPLMDANDGDFMGLTEQYPEWYRAEVASDSTKQYSVRVENYLYTEYASRTLAVMDDGSVFWQEELPEGAQPVETRTVVEKNIKFCKIGGGMVELERTDWAGPDMPIIEVIGDETLPYDDKRRAEGVVRNGRDAGMGENYMISKLVETVGLTPIPPLMVDPDGIEGHELWYQQANTRTLPYLPYRTRDDEGRELREPHRPPVDPNLAPLAQAIALFDGFIQQTTGGAAPDRLGVGQRVQADRAIKRLQEEEQFNTSNFLDNLARSVRYEAQVINNLLYPIYGAKPGRLVRVMTGAGEHQQMLIADPSQGQADPKMAAMMQRAKQVAKLTQDANFNVIVKVKKNADSRRDQFVEMYGQILAGDPAQMMVGGDLYYRNLDIPEGKELAERQRLMLAPPVQQYLAEKESGQQPVPPHVQQQLAQQQEQLQHAEAAIGELQKVIDEKRVEAESKVQVEQIRMDIERMKLLLEREKLQVELEKARMDNATKQYVADVDAKTKGQMQAAEHQHDEMATASQLSHEAEQKRLDRDAQATMAAHDAALAEGQADRAEGEAERGRQFEAGENARNRTATAVEGERNRQASQDAADNQA